MLLNSDLEKLRDRAERLRWLANRASAEGSPDYGHLLLQLAGEAFEQAEDIKRRAAREERRRNAEGCF